MVWCANASLPEGFENCDTLETIKGSTYSCISLAAYNAGAKALTFIYNGCHLFQTSSDECNKSDCFINVEENSRANYCCCDTDNCNENATAWNVEVDHNIYLPVPVRYETITGFTRSEKLVSNAEEYNPWLFVFLAVLSFAILAFVAAVVIQRCVCSRKLQVLHVDGIKEGVEAGLSGEYKSHRTSESDI
ncbi:unnamed protein product [Auanema sp. JU1783]|nr:unnamed protein product [Auanema sp. JU1783]